MSKRDEIIRYAEQYGWHVVRTPGYGLDRLDLTRQPEPHATHLVVEVWFTDPTGSRVSAANEGTGRAIWRLYDGVEGIKRHLRKNGTKK